MSSTVVYQYRYKCDTENKYIYDLLFDEPTQCKNGAGHTIRDINIFAEYNQNVTKILEEHVPTGGNYQTTTLNMNIPAGSTVTNGLWFPIPISALTVHFATGESHRGDIINGTAVKDAITGNITSDVTPATGWTGINYVEGDSVTYNISPFGEITYTCHTDTVSSELPTDDQYWTHGFRVEVSQTVIDNAMVGYYIKLNNFSTSDDLKRIISIDANNNYLYLEKNPTNSYSAATPTYVQMSVYTIKDYQFGEPGEHDLGGSKIGGSHIPKFKQICIEYINGSTGIDKNIVGRIEYLY